MLIFRGETFSALAPSPEPLLRGRRWRLVHPDAPLLVPQTLLRTRRRPLQLVHQQAGVRQVFLIVAPVRRRRRRRARSSTNRLAASSGEPLPSSASPPMPSDASNFSLNTRLTASARSVEGGRLGRTSTISSMRHGRSRVGTSPPPGVRRGSPRVFHVAGRPNTPTRAPSSVHRSTRASTLAIISRRREGRYSIGRDGASMRSPRAELDDSGRRIRRRTRRVDAGEVQPGHVEHANVPSAVAREHVVVFRVGGDGGDLLRFRRRAHRRPRRRSRILPGRLLGIGQPRAEGTVRPPLSNTGPSRMSERAERKQRLSHARSYGSDVSICRTARLNAEKTFHSAMRPP